MAKPDFSKLDKTIIYLVNNIPGLTRTKLVKLLYLADILHYDKNSSSLTAVKYYSYYYGPFSEEIIKAIEKLNHYEIEEYYRTSIDGREYYTYSSGRNLRIAKLDLSQEEEQTLNQTIKEYGAMNLDELLKHVYNTTQYCNSRKGELINLSLND